MQARNRYHLGLLGVGMALGLSVAQADVAVIVNRDGPLRSLASSEVSDLYLGRTRQLEGGSAAAVFEHPRDAEIRQRFFRRLNGMGLNQLNSYWARLQFSGQVLPPPVVNDNRAMLQMVRNHRNAIGYVDAGEVDNSVRVVLVLKEAVR